jgi:hypothetical protein
MEAPAEPQRFSGRASASLDPANPPSTSGSSGGALVPAAAGAAPRVVRRVIGQQVRRAAAH